MWHREVSASVRRNGLPVGQHQPQEPYRIAPYRRNACACVRSELIFGLFFDYSAKVTRQGAVGNVEEAIVTASTFPS
jgi:hypothetical protein